MPMTVITVSNCTPALRGDLTKWMQEISTGVYVGNFNVLIRENLWERVKNNIGNGQATLSYRHSNELGYRFETFQTQRQVIDYDGIELVMVPICKSSEESELKKGFSNAHKFRQAKKFANSRAAGKKETGPSFVVVDIETDGLEKHADNIIEIAAIKVRSNAADKLEILIKTDKPLPEKITKLTGITDEMLNREGVSITDALSKLVPFLENLPIVGYSVGFDIGFINSELSKQGKTPLQNRSYDLLKYVKKEKMYLDNFRLCTVMQEYGIEKEQKHRAMSDAEIAYELAMKVNGFADLIK